MKSALYNRYLQGKTNMRFAGRISRLFVACLTGILAVMVLLLAHPAGALAETVIINGNNVTGKVTNLDWSLLDVDPDFWITFDDSSWLPFPTPTLHFKVAIKIGGSGEFDLDIKNGRLAANITAESEISVHTEGIDKFRLEKNIFDYLPKIGAGAEMEANLFVGATRPATVKGKINSQFILTLSINDGVSYTSDPKVEFSSVIPKNKEEETTVCVGTQFDGGIELGVVEIFGTKFGPILDIRMDAALSGKAAATLHKDEWNGTGVLDLPDNINILHTCTENGEAGCVSGRTLMALNWMVSPGQS